MTSDLAECVTFPTASDSRTLIGTSDAYTANLTPFDLRAKVRVLWDAKEADYLEMAASHVRPWTIAEVEYLRRIVKTTAMRLRDLGVTPELPPSLHLVKTTGWEEGGANGYTRANVIYLNQHSLCPSLFHHELFHIISRYNERRRDAAYATLGFGRCAHFELRDPLEISNPDAPRERYALHVKHQGRPVNATIIIRASRDYAGGSFFPYVRKVLYVPADGRHLDFCQVSGLYEQIGRNTSYTIHQEEICAEHFSHLLFPRNTLPSIHLVHALHSALTVPSDPKTMKANTAP